MARIVEINSCEQCQYGEISQVYTSDSFEFIRKVYCKNLHKDVYRYLEFRDKIEIPEECPLESYDETLYKEVK